jgi:lipopolysaccharide/colanic/teichoic acid biosynthesis glycosyltransferase
VLEAQPTSRCRWDGRGRRAVRRTLDEDCGPWGRIVASTIRRAAETDRRIDVYRRAFDILISAALLLLTLPIVLVAALGSAISLRTWPFFAQGRIGRDGERFLFLKIRTLRPEVPGYIDKHQLDQWQIPAFCRLLRRLHLDELPQLLLVLQGKMSLVGPRPEMGYLHRRMAPAFAAERTSVRPGCTGLWQISEACTELISESPEYDRFYLAHRTLRLDLWVLWRTALNMVGIGACVGLDDVPAWARRSDDALVGEAGLGEPAISLPATAAR